MFRTGHAFPRGRSPNSLRTDNGLLQHMAHRPIAIDGAGADGSPDDTGGVEPCSSNDHGGCGSCIDQVVVPTAPARPSARDKDAVRHRVLNERRLPKPPTSQYWVWKHSIVYAKDALVTIAVCIMYMYLVRGHADF